ncbi:IS4/Tn5 family transposase DNA-binding protein [Thermosporothrix hazakensis]|uniref:IS4/Tn5 family transposase DNA-binding protein n=1 Tax=Thermosporothrix hazakensis TaxID=644383 RepID=UPI0014738AC8
MDDESEEHFNPKLWTEHAFGSYQLQDVRRTRRAVQKAEQTAANASASLPTQIQSWKEAIALYCLLDRGLSCLRP